MCSSILSVVLAAAVGPSAVSALEERVRQEGAVKLAALESAQGSIEIQARCLSVMPVPQGGTKESREKWLYKRNGAWRLFESCADSDDPGISRSLAFGTNENYAFKITKDIDAGKWVVRDLGEGYKKVNAVIPGITGMTYGLLDVSWSLPLGIRISEMLKSPNFKLVSATEGSRPGIVRIDFEFRPAADDRAIPPQPTGLKPPSPGAGIESIIGAMELDSAAYWNVVEYDIKWKNKNPPSEARFAAKVDYSLLDGLKEKQIPVPSMVKLNIDAANMVAKKEVTVTKASLRTIPESEFRLAAYGLPDFGRAAERASTFSTLLLILTVIVCLVLGLALIKRFVTAQRQT